MRTTLNIDEDVLGTAKNIAEINDISLGDAISQLARRGMQTETSMYKDPVSGMWLFDSPAGARKFTMEDVERALDQEYVDEYEKCFPKS